MIITHDNLVLRTVTADDLELIRQWRNAIQVNRFLIARKPITKEEQLLWFESLNHATSIYFMITVNNEPAGLVYANHIHEVDKSFEGHLFIGNSKYENSFIPVKAVIILMILFFERLHFNLVYSTVHKDNTKALDLDAKLGFEETSRDQDFIRSSCTKQNFYKNSAAIVQTLTGKKKAAYTLTPDDKKYMFIPNPNQLTI